MAEETESTNGRALPGLLTRYVLTGLVNTAFSYGVYCAALFVGATYPVAALIGLIAGIFFSFLTMGRIVFRKSLQGRFARFVGLWAVLYLAHIGLIRVLIGVGFDAYLSGLIASGPVVGLSFVFQRYWVFR